jgi:hypothetical protein
VGNTNRIVQSSGRASQLARPPQGSYLVAKSGQDGKLVDVKEDDMPLIKDIVIEYAFAQAPVRVALTTVCTVAC